MALQAINIGSVANDGTGDPLRMAMDKVNDNFNVLNSSIFNVRDYGAVGNGTTDDTAAIQACINAMRTAISTSLIASGATLALHSRLEFTLLQIHWILPDSPGFSGKILGH